MKKKQLFAVSLLGIGALLSLTSCDKDKVSSTSASESTSSSTSSSSSSSSESSSESVHTHTAGTEWKYDDTSHWHLCTVCGEKMDVANHSFEDSVTTPTDEEQGYTLHACECGFSYKDTYVDKKYAISFEGGDFAFAYNLAKEAKAGDKVSFKVTVESGYEAYSITATYGEEKTAIELDGSFGTGFSFTMPKGEVTITPEVRGAYFKVSANDDEVVVDPAYVDAIDKKIKDFIYGYIVDGVKTTGTTLFARAGAKVSVLTNYVAIADDVKYFCDGEELESEIYTETTGEGEEAITKKYDTVYFTMPNHSVTLGVTADEREYTLVVDAPVSVETRMYKIGEDNNKDIVTSTKGGSTTDYVYLDVTLANGYSEENYQINSVSVIFKERDGYEEKDAWTEKTYSATQVTGTSTTTFKYAVSSAGKYYGDITFKVNVREAVSSSWVGDYAGKEFYGGTIGSNYTATADKFGKIIVSSTTYYVVNDDNNGKLSVHSSSSATEPSTYAFYDKDMLVLNYYPGRLSDFTDLYIMIKGKSASDITWAKSTDGNMGDKKAIYIVAKDSSGKELGNFLKAGTDIYLNVTVTYDEGYSNVNDSSNFTVYKDGKQLKHYEFNTGSSSSEGGERWN